MPPSVAELLDRADALRLAGRGADAMRLYDDAIARSRADGDLSGWTRAALGAASTHVYGTDPGRLPAELYDLLSRTVDDADRARIAATLARCWAYAGHPTRASSFAAEALSHAERAKQPALLADCLDAALASHWGPDELEIRVSLAAQLDDLAAHVLDPQTRLQAHLWGLQVACEVLDVHAIHRHMHSLDRLGEESPRALFFAASRRLMLDLLRGRTDTAPQLIRVATDASERAELADAWMVIKSMAGYTAVQTGDVDSCAEIAAEMGEFSLREGSTVICAEAAFGWMAAGRPDKVEEMLYTLHGPVLAELPRDVNWLMTMQLALDAALGVDDRFIVETASALLEPYAGRAVFNSGAVMFHGMTDDTLARALSVLGHPEIAAERRASALATYTRLGASWWRDRLLAWPAFRTPHSSALRLSPTGDGLWLVGAAERPVPVKALKGYRYLRELLRRPGIPLAAIDLMSDNGPTLEQSGLGPTLDRAAVADYRRRLQELEDEIAQAEEWCDTARRESLEAERDVLVAELLASTGLGGRERSTGSSRERARVAVTKALSTAIDRIASVDEKTARHLRRSVHTGSLCAYQPESDEEVRWLLD